MADVYQNGVLYNVGKAIKNGTEYPFDWTMLNEYNQLVTYYDTAQQQIRTSIINKGVNVPANATIDTYPGYIDQIEQQSATGKFVDGLVLRTPLIRVSSEDRIYLFGYALSYVDDDVMILLHPWIYEDYSSSGHSTYDLHMEGWALDGTTSDFIRGGGTHLNFGINGYLNAHSYKCYREGNVVHFQLNYDFWRSSSSDTYYVIDAMYDISTHQWSSTETTVSSDYRLDNTGNMNLYTASWEGTASGYGYVSMLWTPVTS